MDTSTSNKANSRRSSILKPPKPRQPLQNLNFNDSIEESSPSTCKLKRRVSFAEKKHVKEFCNSLEQGTVWDSTYEENDLSNNKVPSANENAHNENVETKQLHIERNSNDTASIIKDNVCYRNKQCHSQQLDLDNVCEVDGDTTKLNLTNPVESMCLINHEKALIVYEDMDITLGATDQYFQLNVDNINCKDKEKTIVQDIRMEFTRDVCNILCPPENINASCNSYHTEIQDTSMKSTQPICVIENRESVTRDRAIYQTVDMLHNAQTIEKLTNSQCTSHNNDSMKITVSSIRDTSMMEVTMPVFSAIKPIGDEAYSRIMIPRVEDKRTKMFQNISMDLTSPIPVAQENIPENTVEDGRPKMLKNLSMELSSPSAIVLENFIKRKIDDDRTKVFKNLSMELTLPILDPLENINEKQVMNNNRTEVFKNLSMELTSDVPVLVENINKKEIENEKTRVFQNVPMNLTAAVPVSLKNATDNIFEDERTRVFKNVAMDFTTAVPVSLKNVTDNVSQDERTEAFKNVSMDFSTAVPVSLKHNTANFSEDERTRVFKNVSMDFTTAVPVSLKNADENVSQDERTRVFKNISMDLTSAVAVSLKNVTDNVSQDERTRAFKNVSMDFSTAVPVSLKHKTANVLKDERTRVFKNVSMDFTTAVPVSLKNVSQDEESRVFKNVSMNLTSAMPVSLKNVTENISQDERTRVFKNISMDLTSAVAVSLKNVTDNVSQDERTRVFKNVSMDFTTAVPVSLKNVSQDEESRIFKNVSMDLTSAMPVSLKNVTENISQDERTRVFKNVSMDFTTAVPVSLKNVSQDEESRVFKNVSMDLTSAMPVSLKNVTANLSQDERTRVFKNVSMELTSAIPVSLKNVPENVSQDERTRVFKNISIDLTSAVAVSLKNVPENISQDEKTRVFKNVSMELTSTIPTPSNFPANKIDGNRTEVFQLLTSEIPAPPNFPENKIEDNRTNIFKNVSMEITSEIPLPPNSPANKIEDDRTGVFHLITSEIPAPLKFSANKIEDNGTRVFENVSMELTLAKPLPKTFPENEIENSEKTEAEDNRTKVFKNVSMELTSAIPALQTFHKNQVDDNRTTLFKDASMDLTTPAALQNIPRILSTSSTYKNSSKKTPVNNTQVEKIAEKSKPANMPIIGTESISPNSSSDETENVASSNLSDNKSYEHLKSCRRMLDMENTENESMELSTETPAFPRQHSVIVTNHTHVQNSISLPSCFNNVELNSCWNNNMELTSDQTKNSIKNLTIDASMALHDAVNQAALDGKNTVIAQIAPVSNFITADSTREIHGTTKQNLTSDRDDSFLATEEIRIQSAIIDKENLAPYILANISDGSHNVSEQNFLRKSITFIKDALQSTKPPSFILQDSLNEFSDDEVEEKSDCSHISKKYKYLDPDVMRRCPIVLQDSLKKPQTCIITHEDFDYNPDCLETNQGLISQVPLIGVNRSITENQILNASLSINDCTFASRDTDFILNEDLQDLDMNNICVETEFSGEKPVEDTEMKDFEEDETHHFAQLINKLKTRAKSDDIIWDLYHENVERRMLVVGFISCSLLIVIFLTDDFYVENNSFVKDVKIVSRLADDADALICMVHRMILEKIDLVGDYKNTKDILTMLDHISNEVKSMMDFMFDVERLDNLNLMDITRDRISFVSRSKRMSIIVNITIDMKPFENIKPSDITVNTMLGTIREEDIKRLIRSVKKNYKFLRRYINDVKDYVDIMEESNTIIDKSS